MMISDSPGTAVNGNRVRMNALASKDFGNRRKDATYQKQQRAPR